MGSHLRNSILVRFSQNFINEIWGRIWGRRFKCNLSIPPPFIEKIAGGSIPINQGGRDYHVKLHFHLRPPLPHCFKEPLQPSALITGKLQQEFFLVTSMSDMPDIAGEAVSVRSCQLKSLRRPVYLLFIQNIK
jgi:hypothetical protein